jgi:hypothetical protein
MAELMEELVDGDVFDEQRFDRGAVEECWRAHMSGADDFSGILDLLATYGCAFR